MNSDPRGFGVQHQVGYRIPGGVQMGFRELQRRQLLEVESHDLLYLLLWFSSLDLFAAVPLRTAEDWSAPSSIGYLHLVPFYLSYNCVFYGITQSTM